MLLPMTDRDDAASPQAGNAAGPGGPTPMVSAVHEVCPYLVAEGGAWRVAQPSRDHRCAAVRPPVPLGTTKQRSLCLTSGHTACATFRAAEEIAATATHRAAGSDRGGLWPTSRSTMLVLEPAGGAVRLKSGGVGISVTQAAVVGVLVLAIVAAVGARIILQPGEPQPSTVPSFPLPSSSAVGSPGVSVPPSTEPTAVPSTEPTAIPSPSPTVAPTPAPTATPRPSQQTYVVKSGDTLSRIAGLFHTTVAALRAANNLTPSSILHPGQVLVIP